MSTLPDAKKTTDRRSGHTTSQMLDAPHRAVFIWGEQKSLSYAKALAEHLGRSDLTILAAHTLNDGARWFLGREISGLVIDHSVKLNKDQWNGCLIARSRVSNKLNCMDEKYPTKWPHLGTQDKGEFNV